MKDVWITRLAGVVGLAVIVGAVGLTLGIYQKVFADVVTVTVTSERAGLLLDKGAKVRAFGLPVGEVRSVEVVGDGVEIEIAISAEHAGRIPSGVTADIDTTTVFGAKYVDLNVPDGPVVQAIGQGEVIQATAVATEANDVFAELNGVLTAIDPVALNTTLTAMATSLDGRGEDLGGYLSTLNSYVGSLNDVSGALEADIEQSVGVIETYADVAPEFLEIAGAATITSETLSANAPVLQTLLTSLSQSARVGQDFVTTIERPLLATLSEYRPVTELGVEYAPGFTCTILGLANHREIVNRVFGVNPGIQGSVSLLPSQDGYVFPDHLPKLATGMGPDCFSLPDVSSVKYPGRHYFDDGSDGVYPNDNSLELGDDPVSIYTDLVEDYFGSSGLALLLGEAP